MRILLIAPASGEWRGIARRRLFNGRAFRFSMLSLLTLAELAPSDADITLVDEQLESAPESGDFDLVGITAMTAAAPRAYQIARVWRRRGVPVVMGGFHATLNTEEALRHVDCVVAGPAYGAWEQLLEDLAAGRPLRRIYHGSLCGRIPARLPRERMDRARYLTPNAVFASLGCRNNCRFCSIRAFHEGKRVFRDPMEVASEIADFSQRFFIFVDDNLTQDRDQALSLFRHLEPLGKQWVTQVSIETADDAEMLDAMQKAGCIGVFVGLESFDPQALRAQNKEIRSPDHYREAVRQFHRRGIYVEAGIIFGFDTDTPEVFRHTLRMLKKARIDAIQASILTPLPGTPLFKEMEPRIFDRDWSHYDYRHAVFTPGRMTAEQLQAGADWIIRRFYSPSHITARFMQWLTMPHGVRTLWYALGLNLAYFGRTLRFGIRGRDPAEDVRRDLNELRTAPAARAL